MQEIEAQVVRVLHELGAVLGHRGHTAGLAAAVCRAVVARDPDMPETCPHGSRQGYRISIESTGDYDPYNGNICR